MPGDAPESVEDHSRRLRALPPSLDSLYWVALDVADGRALGLGNTTVMAGEANRHIVEFSVRVRPDARRRGIGTRLLGPITEDSSEDKEECRP